jgi:phosphoenolpyruvate carboxylase
MVLEITGEKELVTRFKRFKRKLDRRNTILQQAGVEQARLVKQFRARSESNSPLDDLIPLLLSINCVSAGLGWTG